MRPRIFGFLLSGSLVVAMAGAAKGELRVWTITQTQHVLRGDAPGEGRLVKLAMARNEWRGFQILVRSDTAVGGIRVEAGDLRGPDGAAIKADTARLYRQHQVELKQGTYRNESFKADWYPDPLIPVLNPATGQTLTGARFTAMPFDLPENQTHGFWVDVYVPADAKAGVYRVRIKSFPGRARRWRSRSS